MGEELRKCKSEKVKEGGADNKAMAEVTNGSSVKSQFENHEVTSNCSKDHESSGFVKKNLSSSDLKNEEYETEISMSINKVSRETSPTRELYGDSKESLMVFSFQSKKKPSSPANTRREIHAEDYKMPSAKTLEEFFAAEEKYQQQRFAEKYNYDIINDVPFEGRYEWFRLN